MQARNEQMRKILKNDPLIGDTACQNRAIYLVCIAERVRLGIPLTKEEEQFLEDCEFLTKIKKDTEYYLKIQNEGIIIKKEEIGKSLDLSSALFPASVKSKCARDRYISQKKAEVAKASLLFMLKNLADLQISAEMTPDNEYTFGALTISNNSIPIFPFYLSVKLFIKILNNKGIDLVVTALVVQKTGDGLESCNIVGNEKILYRKQNNQYRPELLSRAVSEEKEAVEIVFVEAYSAGAEVPNYAAYLDNFQSEDILEKILRYGGNHPQYPTGSSMRMKEKMRLFGSTVAPYQGEKPIVMNDCSLADFEKMKALADETGIMRNVKFVDHVACTMVPFRASN